MKHLQILILNTHVVPISLYNIDEYNTFAYRHFSCKWPWFCNTLKTVQRVDEK